MNQGFILKAQWLRSSFPPELRKLQEVVCRQGPYLKMQTHENIEK